MGLVCCGGVVDVVGRGMGVCLNSQSSKYYTLPICSIHVRSQTRVMSTVVAHATFLGHTLQLPDDELAKVYALYTTTHGKNIQKRLGDRDGLLGPKQIGHFRVALIISITMKARASVKFLL